MVPAHLTPKTNLNKIMLAPHPAQVMGRIKASEVKSSIEALWNSPYPACPVLEPECANMTYGQVAVMRQVQLAASGDPSAFDRLVDRMIGRPMQVNQNLNVNKSYRDFCADIAREEGMVIDADSTGRSDSQDPQTLQ